MSDNTFPILIVYGSVLIALGIKKTPKYHNIYFMFTFSEFRKLLVTRWKIMGSLMRPSGCQLKITAIKPFLIPDAHNQTPHLKMSCDFAVGPKSGRICAV